MKQERRNNRTIAIGAGIFALLIIIVFEMGIGYYSSGSAVLDLEEGLRAIHGEPYTGREVENGTEDMEFSVEPDTFFLTNYGWREFFGLDYKYKCKVTYTVYSDGEIVSVRTITYTGIDPMGQGKEEIRAYIDIESAKESSVQL